MINPEREIHEYFQVDRPVLSGGDEYLSRVRALAKSVIGVTDGGSLPFTAIKTTENVDGDEILESQLTVHQNLYQPRVEVFSPQDLRMILLRRTAPKQMASNFNFSAKAHYFNHKRTNSTKRSTYRTAKLPRLSAIDDINTISGQAGFNAHETPVQCSSVVPFEDPVWGSTLALVPQPGHPVVRHLNQQIKKSFEVLREQAPKLAYSGNLVSACVPFAKLPDDLNDFQYARFLEVITDDKLLPVRLVLGGVAAYCHETAGRKTEPSH